MDIWKDLSRLRIKYFGSSTLRRYWLVGVFFSLLLSLNPNWFGSAISMWAILKLNISHSEHLRENKHDKYRTYMLMLLISTRMASLPLSPGMTSASFSKQFLGN